MAGKSRAQPDQGPAAADFAAAYHRGRRLAGADPRRLRSGRGPAPGPRASGSRSSPAAPAGSSRATMKASPLLRAWTRRLEAAASRSAPAGAGSAGGRRRRASPRPTARARVVAGVTVLALGGGSWARLGSDGAWTAILAGEGVPIAPFRPSNVGFRVAWSPAMARHFGAPVKPVRLTAGGRSLAGRVRRLGPRRRGRRHLRARRPAARRRAARPRPRARPRARPRSPRRLARPAWRRVARQPPAQDAGPLAGQDRAAARMRAGGARRPGGHRRGAQGARRCRSPGRARSTRRSRPPAASPRAALDAGLMLRARPGVFCAGEMLDWDAPTGGYLLTACLATGRHAGRAAARWLRTAEVAIRPRRRHHSARRDSG